jgi:hypothetical protein
LILLRLDNNQQTLIIDVDPIEMKFTFYNSENGLALKKDQLEEILNKAGEFFNDEIKSI